MEIKARVTSPAIVTEDLQNYFPLKSFYVTSINRLFLFLCLIFYVILFYLTVQRYKSLGHYEK